MLRSTLLVVTFLASFVFYAAAPVEAASTNMSRAEIRAMPIQTRPSRPGHVYGNTVRRRGGR